MACCAQVLAEEAAVREVLPALLAAMDDDDGEENVDAGDIGASSAAGGGTSRLGLGPSLVGGCRKF